MAIYRFRSAVPGNKRDDYYEWNRKDEMKLRPVAVARYISTSRPYISKLIKENILIKDSDGFIDTKNKINILYFERKFSDKRPESKYKNHHYRPRIYPDGYLSPAKLAEKLEISKAAISKAIRNNNLIKEYNGSINLNNQINLIFINRGKGKKERHKNERSKRNEELLKTGQKECCDCKQVLSLSDFYYNKTYSGKCINCCAIATGIWAKANKEKIKINRDLYKEKYKDIINEKGRKYYHDNNDKIRNRNRINERKRMQDEKYRINKRQYQRNWKKKIIDECKEKENIFAENNKELIMILDDIHETVKKVRRKARINMTRAAYRAKFPEKCREKDRKKYKRYREKYGEKLKEKARLYTKRRIETISDTYIISILNNNSIIRIKKADVPPGYFELYRANLMLKRELKNFSQGESNERKETVNHGT